MESLEYINLAVGTDSTRLSLCKPYRDTNSLYGCDGHRLHYIDNLPTQAPSYVDGSDDYIYPHVRGILPKEGSRSSYSVVMPAKRTMKELDAFLKLYKAFACEHAECFFERGSMRIVLQNSDGFNATMRIPGTMEHQAQFKVLVHLPYLVDALRPALKNLSQVQFEFYGENFPLKLITVMGATTLQAIICPIRAIKA